MAMQHWFLVAALAATACGTASSTSSAGPSDVAVGSADSGTRKGDSSAGSSADSASQDADAFDASAWFGDAAAPDADAWDADAWDVDTAGWDIDADAWDVDTDAGCTPSWEVGTSSLDLVGGSISCEKMCNHIEAAGCSGDLPKAMCISACLEIAYKVPAGCEAPMAAYVECMSSTTPSCNACNKMSAAACKAPFSQYLTCACVPLAPAADPTCDAAPVCPPATCSASTGTPTTCGCALTCQGHDYAIDCDDQHCSCVVDGKNAVSAPTTAGCANPEKLLKTLCGAP